MNSEAELTLTDKYGQIHKVTTPIVRIGSGEQCTIIFDEPGVLDLHAEIRSEEGQWILQNLSNERSINVNNEVVPATRPLNDNDVISIGGVLLRVSIREPQPIIASLGQVNATPQEKELRDLSVYRSGGQGSTAIDLFTTNAQQVSRKPCRACNQLIHSEAEICPYCGVRQKEPPAPTITRGKKNRVTAALLGIFLGGFGAHKFYLGQTVLGLLYFVFSWTYVPGILGLIEGIQYLKMSDEQFAEKYG